ncbi:MAG: tRNA pseudouridine(55) synthase TruB [Lentisphaerae bacterium]|nr:MAG: tRNA pseudouridine(55) synthase TruB [Lentisphaerota bacterium]
MASVPSGILLVDKPEGWTSHDVVAFVRKFGVGKVGHCGTLDPMATGLLVLVIGKATRLSATLSGHDKVYEAELKLGERTDSQDAMGNVTGTQPYPAVSKEDLENLIRERFSGEILQIPPMVSAIKKKGQRLYRLARKGIEVPRDPRPITVHDWRILEVALPYVRSRIHCSKGTYVRTLCADLGDALGCGAHMTGLRRLRSGPFSVESAVSIETLKTLTGETLIDHMIPLDELKQRFPVLFP